MDLCGAPIFVQDMLKETARFPSTLSGHLSCYHCSFIYLPYLVLACIPFESSLEAWSRTSACRTKTPSDNLNERANSKSINVGCVSARFPFVFALSPYQKSLPSAPSHNISICLKHSPCLLVVFLLDLAGSVLVPVARRSRCVLAGNI